MSARRALLYAYPDSRGYHFCDGIRTVTQSGEVLPHAGGEVTLTVKGLGCPLQAGYSSMCTHAFITSAAVSQSNLRECHKIEPTQHVVHCPMGVTLQALGTIRLLVVVADGPSPPSHDHGDTSGPPLSAPARQVQLQGGTGAQPGSSGLGAKKASGPETLVAITFVVVEGQMKECMLDSEALRKVGLSAQDLIHPPLPVEDPSVEFQRACVAVQRARDPTKHMAYYPVPEGARKPVLTFGIGRSVVRSVKGVLVMLDDAGNKDEPRLITRQVLDGPGQNVLIKDEGQEDHHSPPPQTTWKDSPSKAVFSTTAAPVSSAPVATVERPVQVQLQQPGATAAGPTSSRRLKLNFKSEGPTAEADDWVVPAWWGAVEGLLILRSQECGGPAASSSDRGDGATAYEPPSSSSSSSSSSSMARRGPSTLASVGLSSGVGSGHLDRPAFAPPLHLSQCGVTTSTILHTCVRLSACRDVTGLRDRLVGGQKRGYFEEGPGEHKRGRWVEQGGAACSI